MLVMNDDSNLVKILPFIRLLPDYLLFFLRLTSNSILYSDLNGNISFYSDHAINRIVCQLCETLTFLQHRGLADFLRSHGELRLLLAGGYDGLQVVIAFLYVGVCLRKKYSLVMFCRENWK